MPIDFWSPSARAASSDLAVSVSPLGLVELADEEFEVHGPRLNRYAAEWAWYLGHHWSYRREMGEQNITLNYVRTFADYVINFAFGKGIEFQCPEQNNAIIPHLLQQVWEVHNYKHSVLWEMGQLGVVTGDCFLKVAFEEPWQDPLGIVHEGKIRLIPLNPSSCFPEYHPHDRDRIIRFKLKYRFWGCVDTDTEALTREGWKRYDELNIGDDILVLDPDTDEITWKPVAAVNIYDYDGHMVAWDNHIDAVSTPNHRWLAERQHGRGETIRYEREIVRTEFDIEGDSAAAKMRKGSRILVGGGTPLAFSDQPKFSDEFVETLAWFVCEGSWHRNQQNYLSGRLAQSATRYPDKLSNLRRLASWWESEGGTFSEGKQKPNGVVEFYLGKGVAQALHGIVGDDKQIPAWFLTSLTYAQAERFYEAMIDADGCRTHGTKESTRWTQLDAGRKDSFQMLCAMLGKRTAQTPCGEKVQVYKSRSIDSRSTTNGARRVYLEDGKIWCPSVEGGIWFARRNGSTYWTGNTSPEGTRQVFTFTEIITDEMVEQYINDELVDQYENAIGKMPIVHIPNGTISSSPWGTSTIYDIISLNRELNEKMTDISDIINYHAAPITIITGAKSDQLQRGPKKVWGGLPKDAKVFNLESRGEMAGALEYVQFLKRAMHEHVGVPENALGQMQPISNTSGVALAIQYQPIMNRYNMIKVNYSKGLEQINELIIRTAAVFRPELLQYDPTKAAMPEPDQATALDPSDPMTYRTTCHWPEPLPVDVLIKLNEVQAKMGLGLESKLGALRILGEKFPNEKMDEIFEELQKDALDQGALDMLRAQISQAVMLVTGMIPGPDGAAQVASAGGSEVNSAGQGGNPLPGTQIGDAEGQMINKLVQRAYGARFAQRRVPDEE